MAKRCGVSGGHYCMVENGEVEPSLKLMRRIARVLQMPVHDLWPVNLERTPQVSVLLGRGPRLDWPVIHAEHYEKTESLKKETTAKPEDAGQEDK